MNERRFRLRVTYSITGKLSMLSHLEVARSLERMVRRAHLPFAVSNGFSPHMKIAFGSALPVGVGGTNEIFDLQLRDYVPKEKALSALQDASVPGIDVLDAEYICNDEPAASVAFPVSVYRACLDREVDRLAVPESIDVKRKKKTKHIQVSDHLLEDIVINGNEAMFSLVALPSGSLRPDVLLKACLGESGLAEGDKPVKVRSICRIGQKKL